MYKKLKCRWMFLPQLGWILLILEYDTSTFNISVESKGLDRYKMTRALCQKDMDKESAGVFLEKNYENPKW